jgi:hypothetical protein
MVKAQLPGWAEESPMRAIPPRSIAVAKADHGDHAWRTRTLLAFAILTVVIVAFAAANLDWSSGPAMALGQLAGMLAPVAILAVVVWAAAALSGRNR